MSSIIPGLVLTPTESPELAAEARWFQKTTRNKMRMLKDRVATIEPFRTALDLVSRKKVVTAQDVADSLAEIGLKWHYKPDLNEALVRTLLIHWAIYADLLGYDGKSGEFRKAQPKP